MKVTIIFYSAYGHMAKMAKAAAEGASKVQGVQVELRRIPETLPDSKIRELGIDKTIEDLAHIPLATLSDLETSAGLIFGVPTRYGNMPAQVKAFLDSTGPLWATNALVGKVGSVMSSSATQHGGQETTILSTMVSLLHHGMIIQGLAYAFPGQKRIDEITGGSPYGASTITGGSGERMPSENELDAARYQGEAVAKTVNKLFG